MTFSNSSGLFCIALIGWLAASSWTKAQDAANAIPPPPYLQLPARAAWTVTFGAGGEKATKEPEAGAASGPLKLVRIESRKVDSLKQDILVYSDGHREEIWYLRKFRLEAATEGDEILVINPDGFDYNSDAQYSSGVPGSAWLTSSATYRGVKNVGQTACYYFEGNAGEKGWISVKTGLPVQFQSRGLVYTIEFHQPPSGELSLPESYRIAWERFERIDKMDRAMRQADVNNKR